MNTIQFALAIRMACIAWASATLSMTGEARSKPEIRAEFQRIVNDIDLKTYGREHFKLTEDEEIWVYHDCYMASAIIEKMEGPDYWETWGGHMLSVHEINNQDSILKAGHRADCAEQIEKLLELAAEHDSSDSVDVQTARYIVNLT